MQFSQVLRALPVVSCLAPSLLLQAPAPGALAGQARFRVLTDGEWFHQEPDGKRLARLARGAVVTSGTVQGDWIQIALEGWILTASVGPTARAGFDLAVTRAPEENLRSAPAGALVAKLAQGFLLSKVGADGPWVHVERRGWVRRAALQPLAEVASTRTASADSAVPTGGLTPGRSPGGPGEEGPRDTVGSSPPAVDPARAQPARRTTLYRAPDGPATGTLAPTTPLRVLGRSGEWSRVQFEGWVKTADLAAAPPGVLVGVSAAELRADPERYTGQVLRWTVQFIALQTADDLRPDIPNGATYVLARGPLPERGFVYVVVPGSQLSAAQALTPLATVQVTVRVRAARSRFLGNPVVDLLAMEVQP